MPMVVDDDGAPRHVKAEARAVLLEEFGGE
jgi:hypothetical protein